MTAQNTFNSLFEMRAVTTYRGVFAVDKMLSILYLRCPNIYFLDPATCVSYLAFNSLFEMQYRRRRLIAWKTA